MALGRMRWLALALSVCASLRASDATRRAAQIYPPDASQHKIPLTGCASGATTVLRCGGLSRSKRHKGNSGEAHFVLESKSSGAVLWKDEYVGEGICLGYNPGLGIYVIGSRRQQGIGVRLTDVRYVLEKERASRASAFDKQELEAFAAVASPGLRYIALIAISGNDIALFVLDVKDDRITRTGKAPLPPPLDAGERAYVKAHPEALDESKWDWMASFRDGYMRMDPGIIEFEDESLLRIRYGADTPYARSPQRETVSVTLPPS